MPYAAVPIKQKPVAFFKPRAFVGAGIGPSVAPTAPPTRRDDSKRACGDARTFGVRAKQARLGLTSEHSKSPAIADDCGTLAGLLVAGRGFEPLTFRL